VRLAEIQHQQASARFCHAPHLPQTRLQIRQIPQTVTDGHDVKAPVRKRHMQRITLQKLNAAPDFKLWTLNFGPFPRHREHGIAEIEPDYIEALTRKGERDVSRAAAKVEHAFPGFSS